MSMTETIKQALEQRDRARMEALFERIEQDTEAWPANSDEKFLANVIASVAVILDRMGGDDWKYDGALEMQAARIAAWLLIEQMAWRKSKADELFAETMVP